MSEETGGLQAVWGVYIRVLYGILRYSISKFACEKTAFWKNGWKNTLIEDR